MKRQLSAAARRRISEAQKARWAKTRQESPTDKRRKDVNFNFSTIIEELIDEKFDLIFSERMDEQIEAKLGDYIRDHVSVELDVL